MGRMKRRWHLFKSLSPDRHSKHSRKSDTPLLRRGPDEFWASLPECIATVWHLISHITLFNPPHTLFSSPRLHSVTLGAQMTTLSWSVPMLGPRWAPSHQGAGRWGGLTGGQEVERLAGGVPPPTSTELLNPLLSRSRGKPFNTCHSPPGRPEVSSLSHVGR